MTEDIQKFARTVKGIAKYRYEPQEVLREFEDNQYLISKRQALEILIDEKQKNLTKLKQHDRLLRHAINSHSEKLSIYNALEHSGLPAAYAGGDDDGNKNKAEDDSAAAIADCDDNDVERAGFDCEAIAANDIDVDVGEGMVLGFVDGIPSVYPQKLE